jgi:predicted transcriptional regulator of viral defense system
MDWIATVAKEAKTSAVIRIREIASKYSLSLSTVSKALKRQEKKGIIEHIEDGIYLNKLTAGFSSRDIINELRPNAYISLETALAEWGLSTQSPVALTCVSTSKARTIRTESAHIIYRKIKEDLFWGFLEKKTRYTTYKIAEPEKALLDWIYFHLQDGLPVQLDEVQFQKLNQSKLLEYAKKYPSTVLKTLFLPLLEHRSTI